jgi:hypothetical protein
MLPVTFNKLAAVRKAIDDQFADIRSIIAQIKFDKLKGFRLADHPNIVDIRPGYKIVDGKLLASKAIVFIVRDKKAQASLKETELIPKYVDGAITDVTPMSGYDQLRLENAVQLASLVPGATTLNTDYLLDSDRYNFSLVKPAEALIPQIGYQPPPGVSLDEVNEAMTLVCHVSPEEGWNQLGPFLDNVEGNFTLGMYDLSAPQIRDSLVAIAARDIPFHLVYDGKAAAGVGKPGNKKNDVPEDEVIGDIAAAAKTANVEFDHVKASLNKGGLFANAYHIKVAVSNKSSFWLSSGNMQSSNQPVIEEGTAFETYLANYNREWHVICLNEKLAATYDAFLEWDLQQSQARDEGLLPQLQPEETFQDLVVTQEALVDTSASQRFPVAKFDFTAADPVRIQPLLTPDNYIEKVLPLIQGAKTKLYFQNQYIHTAKTMTDQFIELLTALKDKANDPGIDCRIILRNEPDVRLMMENLVAFEFPANKIRIQNNCHTKGIVIDEQIVVVGSHNWSNSGVQFNRDASLVIHSEKVAAYYGNVFVNDWDHLSVSKVPEGSTRPAEGEAEGILPKAGKMAAALESIAD